MSLVRKFDLYLHARDMRRKDYGVGASMLPVNLKAIAEATPRRGGA